ncbi:hypothetical protein [Pseudomonas sp. PSE14]|uniref:hypothetical protein n=1 Tax=Pseudomonas TaxID=286 RepID=UPI0023D7BF0E|nr:hypothetical protein [Pseudomonas sp. PSE14]WEJ70118.1 hypothetical protein O6P39_15680 [Pseudomonas sp. PSE14]
MKFNTSTAIFMASSILSATCIATETKNLECEYFSQELSKSKNTCEDSRLFCKLNYINGKDQDYQDVDLDGDGVADEVVQSCGASADSPCSLYVTPSKSKKQYIYQSQDRFYMFSYKNSYFIITNNPMTTNLPEKKGRRNILKVTDQDVTLYCEGL